MTTQKTVLVVDRSQWERGPYPIIRAVTVDWTCPVCGGPRGEPRGYNFYEDGDTYHCHRWDNPCGHVDLYEIVINEAQRLAHYGRRS